nr:ModD protein [Campylobacter geochelonis]
MNLISDSDILNYINEDLPYFDLTTNLQESCGINARLELFTREDLVVSCSEISARLAEILGCKVEFVAPSKTFLKSGEKILTYSGSYANIHKAWKLSQVLLEYSCKIATYTNQMLNLAKSVNQKCQILGTRKTFPFAKKFCIKALLDGGGSVHRLNLSDSVLFFEKHRILYKNNDEFYSNLVKFKEKIPEKKLCVEALNLDDAINLLEFCDVVQLDKMELLDIKNVVKIKDEKYKFSKIVCAGGINLTNVKEYAKCGVDAVVTSSMYLSKMADLGARISKI